MLSITVTGNIYIRILNSNKNYLNIIIGTIYDVIAFIYPRVNKLMVYRYF